MVDHERTLQNEYKDNTMKTKLFLTGFGGIFGTLRIDEKSFHKNLLGFTPFWDYKPTNGIHADRPGVYTSDEISNLSTIDKVHLKCKVIDGFVVNGMRQSKLLGFLLNKSAGS